MKNNLTYEAPEAEVIVLDDDIIRTSTGTETPEMDVTDGIWDFTIN